MKNGLKRARNEAWTHDRKLLNNSGKGEGGLDQAGSTENREKEPDWNIFW